MDALEKFIELGVVPGITALVTWALSRRKRMADLEKDELHNEEKAITIYKSLCDELKGEIDELRHRVRTQDERLEKMFQENCSLKMEVHELRTGLWRNEP